MEVRLGVNIDHVATLRQARGENYPSLVDAATVALESGADQITIHLREDRRHIQDTDVPAIKLVTQKFAKPLNLEIGANPEIVQIACEVKPEWICLVPEKREERTTEGGLDMLNEKQFEHIKSTCAHLKKHIPNVKISLFVTSDISVLAKCCECDIDAVEIHTGDYAIDFLKGESIAEHLADYQLAHQFIQEQGKGFHAGHGLTDESVKELVKQGLFVEYNIGHWIICDSLFRGLGASVKNLKDIISNDFKKDTP